MKWDRNEPIVRFDIVTATDISDWNYGKSFFELLIKADVRLTPSELGMSDSLKKFESLDSIKVMWGKHVTINGPLGSVDSIWPVAWQREEKLKNSGQVDFTRNDKFGNLIPGHIYNTAIFDEETNWIQLFKETCELTDAIAGFLHVPAVTEIHDRTAGYSKFYIGLSATIRKEQLSNIAWATFFGPPFKHEVDFPRLVELGYHIEEFAGGYLLLMSDSMMDSFNDFPTFSRRRVELKKQFKPDLFRISEEAPMS